MNKLDSDLYTDIKEYIQNWLSAIIYEEGSFFEPFNIKRPLWNFDIDH